MVSLSKLPHSFQRQPKYDREKTVARMVHIGFGAFHRAHQALLTDRLLNTYTSDWAYCEINLIGGEELVELIRKQDHLYSVLEKGADHQEISVIGSIKRSLHANLDGIEAVLDALVDPVVEIVSFTITEKGYCLLPGGQDLDFDHPLVQADLRHPQKPLSAPGVIVEALARRKAQGIRSFTALSCDNLPENGKMLKKAILGIAKARDAELATWIETNTTFPCTMIDRIVPAVTSETLRDIKVALDNIEDPCGIVAEPFIQWVIEDNFVSGRPDWDRVGAQFVDDVVPYEEMKLRMLNGSHSFLAYLGVLAGYQYINECMEDPVYAHATQCLMLNEQAPTLSVGDKTDLTEYACKLVTRFGNPALKHRTIQIAMDGTQKLPQRLLSSIRWHLAQGSDFSCLALGVAAWMRFVGGVNDQNEPFEVSDPMAELLAEIVANSNDGVERVDKLLELTSVFGEDLSQNEIFRENVTSFYLSLMEHGAKQTVAMATKVTQ